MVRTESGQGPVIAIWIAAMIACGCSRGDAIPIGPLDAGFAGSTAVTAGAGGATMTWGGGATAGGSFSTSTAVSSCTKPYCEYGGHLLKNGETLPSTDDCNTCVCETQIDQPDCGQDMAQVTCTQLDCTGSCRYAGQWYRSGANFRATDGCNQCSCFDGTVSCGNSTCSCDAGWQYWRYYEKADAGQCDTIDFACRAGTSVFTNACGCGCEESPDCPAFMVCVEDNGGGLCPSATICPYGMPWGVATRYIRPNPKSLSDFPGLT